jgi:hypothetical protein
MLLRCNLRSPSRVQPQPPLDDRHSLPGCSSGRPPTPPQNPRILSTLAATARRRTSPPTSRTRDCHGPLPLPPSFHTPSTQRAPTHPEIPLKRNNLRGGCHPRNHLPTAAGTHSRVCSQRSSPARARIRTRIYS